MEIEEDKVHTILFIIFIVYWASEIDYDSWDYHYYKDNWDLIPKRTRLF